MTMPNLASSFSIGTAYAIDPQTANNAVATSADNHYMLRYGMLFASAFLQGFGNAYASVNSSNMCGNNTTSCTIITPNGTPNNTVTAKTAAYQGLGQVGTNLGQVAANIYANTPPTVKLAQGTGIGILFMNDVTIPQS
jgi:intracellular multiplication protein IcmE